MKYIGIYMAGVVLTAGLCIAVQIRQGSDDPERIIREEGMLISLILGAMWPFTCAVVLVMVIKGLWDIWRKKS